MSERLCRLIFCRRSLFDVNIPFAPSLCRPFLRPRPRSNKLYDTTVLWIRSPFFVWTYGFEYVMDPVRDLSESVRVLSISCIL